jgi:hypothetical protein
MRECIRLSIHKDERIARHKNILHALELSSQKCVANILDVVTILRKLNHVLHFRRKMRDFRKKATLPVKNWRNWTLTARDSDLTCGKSRV